jgi:hypothetical protein
MWKWFARLRAVGEVAVQAHSLLYLSGLIIAGAFAGAVAAMTWVTSSIAFLSQYGWGLPVLVAVGVVLMIVIGLSFAAVPAIEAWHRYRPNREPEAGKAKHASTSTAPVTPPASISGAPQKNISCVTLVPSGDDLFCLVVTPGRGGASVGVFLDWSAWQHGGIFWDAGAAPAGWATPQRFFLCDFHLRAAGVRGSIEVLERFSIVGDETTKAWRWKIRSADGNPATTQPMSTSTKERATFTFIEQDKTPEQFHFLLVRRKGDLSVPPIVVVLDDFGSDILQPEAS